VEKFQEDRDKDFVYEKVVAIGSLQKSMYKYENEVLTMVGVGTEYDKVRRITESVCEVIQWLEEVLCLAMVDVGEVDKMYKDRQFSFQRRRS
jgi:hypothetical protein